MRTTITLEDDLVETAKSFSGIEETSMLIKTALTQFVQREAGRRLAALGGTMPDLEYPRRRRPGDGDDSNYPEK